MVAVTVSAAPVSYATDVLVEVLIGEELSRVWFGAIIDIVSGSGVDVLAVMNIALECES